MKVGISLGIGAPAQTAALLARAGFEVSGPDPGDAAQFSVSFAPAPGDSHRRQDETTVRCVARGAPAPAQSVLVRSAIEAASFVASRASGAPAPILTADPRTYDALSGTIQAASRRLSLLIEGETGTGKKLLVRMFHAMSGRGLLVLVNGSVDNVLRVAGCSAESHDVGTLFLDNVDELSSDDQAAILSLIRASSDVRSIPNDSFIRYAAATRKPLEQMVRRGRFSRELYRELSRAAVSLPPLRERRRDIRVLADYFLSRSGPQFSFSADALAMLEDYPFPGNVRELENLVRRLSIVPLAAEARIIDSADVRTQILVAARQKAQDPAATWEACREAAQREIALRTLTAYSGDYRAAARRLGMTLAVLRECVGVASPPRIEPRS